MMKRWLRTSERFYRALQRVYYAGLFLSERYVLGTKLHELLWQVRWFHQSGTCGDCDSHRGFLAERVGKLAPFESLLEVGCGGGANLVVLARAYPGARFYGVDISARAIRAAETVLSREAIANAAVFVGRAEDLRSFEDKSVDVVLTDAALMYVGPDKITRTISELARVARKGLIFNEWHLFEEGGSGLRRYWYYAHWVHDYTRLLGTMLGVKAIHVERLPPGLWSSGGGWEAYGALIEAEL